MFDIKLSLKENTSETNCGSFLQTPFWCEFKSRHGWNHLRFIVEYSLNSNQYEQKNDCTKSSEDLFFGDLHRVFEMEVLYRGFAKNLFSIAYIPLKPDLPFECTDEEILNKVLKKHKASIQPIENLLDIPQLPVTIKGTLCVKPTALYEGFFVAKIKKTS